MLSRASRSFAYGVRLRRLRLLALCAALVAVTATPARSATYYVDPATGLNSNNGTSTTTPWKTPPGTRAAGNGGFVSSTWGAITTTAKVACGDTILLKAGATQTSAQGGAWLLDSTYYSTCSAASPIRLKVSSATEWSGSTGNFTLNGTGITPTWSSAKGFSDHAALVSVADRGYIYVLGEDATRRLVVTNSTAWAINVHCNACTNAGFRGTWWELKNGTGGGGFNIGNYTDWQVSNSIAHDLYLGGWQTGLNNDLFVERGGFVDVEVYRTGPSNTQTGGDDGFFLVGGKSVWCIRCVSHNNNQRGVNTGVIKNSANVPFNYRFRDVVSYDNGQACSLTAPVLYCMGAGLYVSGNDGAAAAESKTIVVGGTFFHNADVGVGNYGQGTLEVWNGTFYRTHFKRSDTASVLWDTTARQLSLFNSVDRNRTGFKTFGWNNSNTADPQLKLTPITGNNCFAPITSNTEGLGIGGTGNPPAGTYTAPPAWIGSTNETGTTGCVPAFTALDDTDFTKCDFHPGQGSTLIDNGRFLLRANGAGTNATTITVKSNGGSSDPQQFFVAPTSYLQPLSSDMQVQIGGCGVRTITALTATTISFTPACSWADNTGISLPWGGNAPDIGALESSSSAIAPPALLSVDPVP